MIVNVVLDEQDSNYLEQIKQQRGNKSAAQVLREAIRFFNAFLFGKNYLYTDNSISRQFCSTIISSELQEQAADLPGMTAEVIQSHLVRFPKVTPEVYKGIIEELRQRQQSDEGLKNPEAAAYGLCKRIQNGQPRTATTPQEQRQAQPAIAPDDNPFAIYEP